MNVPCTARVSQQVDTEKKKKKKPALPYRLSVREFLFGESIPWLPCAPREACLLVQASPAWEVQIEPEAAEHPFQMTDSGHPRDFCG